jgi:hypothetical protein
MRHNVTTTFVTRDMKSPPLRVPPWGMGCDTTLPSALQVALGRDATPFCVAHPLLCA